ncbi:Plug domain-containing protein [Kingella potus]|nr:Plug domain-containing protein [Kingella potus]UOP00037.1 Plug domain-containing protein [Kingella potus]
MNHTKLNTLAACLGLLFCTPEIWAEDAAPAQNAAESNALDAVTVHGKRMKADEKGEAQQYSKNVSNAYLGKEYLERYQTDAAGDILKGLNGVYNMNTRNAGSAITPSIRGISGKGRIPVTIDGTEQTVDVWMNNYGTVPTGTMSIPPCSAALP